MEEKDGASFGAVLSRYRAALGLSQEELAERAGLSARGVSDLERGARTRPHATTVHRLAEGLRLAPDDREILERAARRAASAERQPAPSPAPGNFLGALPPVPLVGREEELGRIRSALQAVTEGTGQLVLLIGELGIGKTRLAQEVTVQIRDLESSPGTPVRFLVGTGRCYQRHQETPYVPLFEALAELTETAPPGGRSALEPRWAKLRRDVDTIASNGSAGIDAQRSLFAAVTEYITAVSAIAPVALLLDDLHEADDGTISLLQHLAHETRGTPTFLVATLRDTHLSEEHRFLAQTLRDLARERLAERIVVGRLSAEETACLAASLMGQEVLADDIAAFIYRRTKGIPRFIEGMVRALGGRLELHGEIGAGAMGRVFAAYDAETEREVAAKIMLVRSQVDLDTVLCFQREAAVLAKLRHPGIVEIYDSFIDEHASCIIMERLDGQSLGQLLQAGPLSLSRTKYLGQQIADALAYAHSQQIVHRDIKPDNVMVLPGDQVKVTDFGIARILQPDTSLQTMATTGMRIGTPLYMAPEQIEGREVDGRTDVYALGAMLYHMVTGRPPFEGSDALAVAVKHLQREPIPPSQIDPGIPADWDALILKAMAKDPAKRFGRATEMKEALAAAATEVGSSAHVLAGQEPVGPAEARGWRSTLAQPARKKRVPEQNGGEVAVVPAVENQTVPHPPPAHRLNRMRDPRNLAFWGATLLTIVVVSLIGGLIIHAHVPLGAGTPLRLGRPVASWSSWRSPPLQFPAGVAVDPQGTIYVADEFNGIIQRLSPAGVALAPWGTHGAGSGQLSLPVAVAVGRSGSLYVADGDNRSVQQLSPAGQLIAQWPTDGSIRALTVDRQGNVYAAERSSLEKWSAAGRHLAAWGNLGAAAVAVDARGNLFVLDGTRGRVIELSSQGKRIPLRGLIGTDGTFADPAGVAVAGDGDIYVADRGRSRIEVFSPTGWLLRQWGSYGAGPGQFEGLSALALTPQGDVIASDGGNDRIQEFSGSGRLLAQWGPTLPVAKMAAPEGTATDAQGNVYVTDSLHQRLLKLSQRGVLLQAWGGQAPFDDPYGVAADGRGDLYVTDQVRNHLDKLSSAGQLLWRTGGGAGGAFSAPAGVATDRQGDVYVADTGNNRIVVFSGSGSYLRQWGTTGSDVGQFQSPIGVAVDAQGHVLVADSINNRIQRFTSSGTPLAQWGDTGPGAGGGEPGRFRNPEGIAVDRSGDVFVADTGNNRIQELAPDGHARAVLDSSRSGRGRLNRPSGIAIDPHGTIYVADTGTNRVLKVAPFH